MVRLSFVGQTQIIGHRNALPQSCDEKGVTLGPKGKSHLAAGSQWLSLETRPLLFIKNAMRKPIVLSALELDALIPVRFQSTLE